MTLPRCLRILTLSCLAMLCVSLAAAAGPASAKKDLESMFQDDNQLIFNDTPGATAKVMDQLTSLGVDRIRVSVFWATVAPDSKSTVRPANFDAANPDAYPSGAWARYDQIVRLARERDIAVNFNVTSPAPFWATGNPVDRPDLKETFDPSAKEFGQFVHALGKRYSGAWTADGSLIPRVRYWSIWNEPNQAAWLSPQSARDPRSKKAFVETAPVLYRNLVDAAWSALQSTDHGTDTILIGETAPKGGKSDLNTSVAMDPLRFIRQLYCLDKNLQLYKGTSAQLRGCPVGPKALTDFVTAHPALFQATGYAHHPYALTSRPSAKFRTKDWVTIGNLPALSKLLRKVYQRYRQLIPDKQKNVPLYLTEFGYQSRPPDPSGVSLKQQAAFNNESEYLAWKDSSARTLSQFLLVDDKPVDGKTDFERFGKTFQTGLLTCTYDKATDTCAAGRRKPAYSAYALGIFLPSARATSTRNLRVWGVARIAPRKKVAVTVELRSTKKGSKFKKAGSLKTDARRGYVFGNVRVKRAGDVRLAYKTPNGRTYHSRPIAFTLKKK